MSWSFPDRSPAGRLGPVLVAGLMLLAPAARPARAAEYYVQPIATLTSELDSNLDLDPSTKQWIEGYVADLATIIGIATPDSQTLLKPRLIYREYPQDSGDDRLEGYLDLNSTYRTQRSVTTVLGTLEHQDEFNAEFTPATYNDINPVQPTPDTGKAIQGATRDSVTLFPKYQYNFTPLFGAGVSGQYQKVNYTPTDPSYHADFYIYQARAFLSYTFSPRSDVALGAYTSQYEATHFDARAIGTGETLDFRTQWTPLLSTEEGLVFQHTNIADVLPEPLVATVNTWGARAAVVYKKLADQFRLTAVRSISPSGGGGVYVVEKLQLEYDRNVTARLSVTGALVALRTHGLTYNLDGDDRRYAQGLVEARWMLTPTWFVQGGAQYAWQKYQYDLTSGENTRIYLQVGYQGLARQR